MLMAGFDTLGEDTWTTTWLVNPGLKSSPGPGKKQLGSCSGLGWPWRTQALSWRRQPFLRMSQFLPQDLWERTWLPASNPQKGVWNLGSLKILATNFWEASYVWAKVSVSLWVFIQCAGCSSVTSALPGHIGPVAKGQVQTQTWGSRIPLLKWEPLSQCMQILNQCNVHLKLTCYMLAIPCEKINENLHIHGLNHEKSLFYRSKMIKYCQFHKHQPNSNLSPT